MNLNLTDSILGAQSLLGCLLIHETPEGRTAGYIVETEAYTMEDPASHTYRGRSDRNWAMFEEAGTIYVYFTYGMHYCMNIVTGTKGHGQGALIRALEPVEGIELMQQRRGRQDLRLLTNGPGKLTQAMGVGPEFNGVHIDASTLRLVTGFTPKEIVQTTRIGISRAVDQPWRFYVKDNLYVSKR